MNRTAFLLCLATFSSACTAAPGSGADTQVYEGAIEPALFSTKEFPPGWNIPDDEAYITIAETISLEEQEHAAQGLVGYGGYWVQKPAGDNGEYTKLRAYIEKFSTVPDAAARQEIHVRGVEFRMEGSSINSISEEDAECIVADEGELDADGNPRAERELEHQCIWGNVVIATQVFGSAEHFEEARALEETIRRSIISEVRVRGAGV